mgnify:CR=1 FL=1
MFKINKDVITAIASFAFVLCFIVASECFLISLFSGKLSFIFYTIILYGIANVFIKIVPDIKKEIYDLINV